MLKADDINEIHSTLTPKKVIEYFFRAHYTEELEHLLKNEKLNSLKVDYQNFIGTLEDHNHHKVVKNNFPELIKTAESIIVDQCKKEYAHIILMDVPYNTDLRVLDSRNVGEFISTTAMVKSVSPIKPRLIITLFECTGCLQHHKVTQLTNHINEPAVCSSCGGKSFNLISNESKFINTLFLKLEEPLELRKGSTTREFIAIVEGDLVNPEEIITPGSVVEISGFFETIRYDKSEEWNFILQVNQINPITETYKDIKLTEEDIKYIETLARKPGIFKKLTYSILPGIYGYQYVKEGLIMQLFSGNNENKTGKLKRSDIHVLLVGDPGVSKSEILIRMAEHSPKGFYVNGAKSSKAGILAVTFKDELTGRWTMEAGAIPLADQGLICIDEMDKMVKSDVLSLNEPMEQQTVTVTNAGLNITMNARTPVLAAANPKHGRFKRDDTIIEQIILPDTTFSRFDLVYALEDNADYTKDLKLARNLLNDDTGEEDILDSGIIRKFVAYAKREIHPKLTPEAREVLTKFYAETRKAAAEDDDAKLITPRDLQALQRIAITYTRVHLREIVTPDDACEAIRIYSEALKTVGLTPQTGGDLRGVPSNNELQNINTSQEIVMEYYQDYGHIIPFNMAKEAIQKIKLDCNVSDDKAKVLYRDAMKELEQST